MSGPPRELPAGSLTHSVTTGFAWLTVQTASTKVVTFLGQIALAKLLLPEDFGVVGLAYTVTAFTGLLQQAGVKQVLLSRRNRFRLWAGPAAWLGLTAGLLMGAVLLAIAPLAARVYGEPVLVGLLWVLALNSPLEGLQAVPDAKLRSGMRFRAVAIIAWFRAAGVVGLSVLLAWKGFGPYSFVIPQPLMSSLSAVALWSLSGPLDSWKPRLRRWRFLLSDSLYVVASTFFYLTVAQGNYFLLGVLYSSAVVGIYFFAYQISMQSVSLITAQLVSILFPALAHFRSDPQRQLRAFLRAMRLVALVVTPICLIQVPLAGPVIRLVFDARWHPAIPLIQILSIGMVFRTIGFAHAALIQAQGRFRTQFFVSVGAALGFFALAVPAAVVGQAIGMALAVCIHASVIGPINAWVTIRPVGGRVADFMSVVRVPLAASVIAVTLGGAAAALIPSFAGADGLRIATILLTAGTIYVLLIARLAPDDLAELVLRASHVVRQLQRRRGAQGV